MKRAVVEENRGSTLKARHLLVRSVILGVAMTLGVVSSEPLNAQEPNLDDSCVVSVLNRTARVDPFGTWVLPNVPAAIGQVRLRATCVDDGVTRGGQSDVFTVPADGVIRVQEIHFDDPVPVPERLVLSAPDTTLTNTGQAVPLTVLALYPDGTSTDLTPAAAGTNYVISNPAVATISPDGEVTAVASGTVIVSAMNDGANGFLRLQVVLAGDSDGDGIPDDVEISLGLDPNDPVDALTDRDGDGLTAAEEIAYGSDPDNPDSDGDGLTDGEEVQLVGTDPVRFDTDGDGLSDGLEIATGSDPLDAASYDLASALTGVTLRPTVFVLNTNTVLPGDAAISLTLEGTLLDGSTIDLTPSSRGTTFSSSDLFVCNFGLDDGVVFGGAEGSCTITASNSGFTTTAEGLVQEFAPGPIGTVTLPSYGNAVAVREGWAFVAGGPGGLHVLDISLPRQPRVVTTLPLSGNANDLVLQNDLAFVAAGEAGVHVVDLTDPWAPRLIASADTPGTAIALRSSGGNLYVADGPEGLQILSLEDPTAPTIVGSWSTPGSANGLAVAGGLAVVSTRDTPLELVDVSTPSAPVGLSTLALPGLTFDVEILDSFAYVATSSELRVVDLTTPLAPVDLGAFGASIWMIDLLAVGDDRIFTTQVEPRTRMPIFDLRQDPAAPFFAGLIQFADLSGTIGDGIHLAADEHFVYMTASTGFAVESKPGTTGSTRLLIGQHEPFEDAAGDPPNVEILSPEHGTEVPAGSQLEVRIAAEDDVAVLDVALLVDGQVVARDGARPYRFILDAPQDPGAIELQAHARDFGGAADESTPVTIHVVADIRTTVVGTVETAPGEPVTGATVFSSLGGSAVTGPAGEFVLSGLPAPPGDVVVFAAASLGQTDLRGRSAPVPVVPDGVTDVGVIPLVPLGLPYPAPRATLGSLAPDAEGFAVADFDRDGVVDLVAAGGSGSSSTVVFLAGRGDGTFEPFRELFRPSSPYAVAAADLNLDGLADFVVVDSPGDVWVALGRGDGTFDPAVSYTTAAGLRDVAIADFDLDLVPDLIVAGANPSQPAIFRGRGDGTFDPPTILTLATPSRAVDLGDFDGDGITDAVFRERLTVVFGNGDGTFSAPVQLLPNSTVNGVAVGDLNSDGLDDLFVLERPTFSFTVAASFLAVGARSFERQLASTAPQDPTHPVLADLNADGTLDALVQARDWMLDQPVGMLLLGDGSGAFEEGARHASGSGAAAAKLADLDGDGLLDHVIADRGGISVFLGKGAGFDSYTRNRDIPYRQQINRLAVGDLDLDGLTDMVATGPSTVGYYLRQPDGGFGNGVRVSMGYTVRDAKVMDVDHDGVPDLVSSGTQTVSVLRNLGDGSFSAPEHLPVGLLNDYVAPGDYTGDGFVDLAIADSSNDSVILLANDGSGTFGVHGTFPTGDNPRWIATLDLEGDGDLDLAVLTTRGTPGLSLLANDGSGAFSIQDVLVLGGSFNSLGPVPLSVVAADLDGDGREDLVTCNLLDRSVSVFRGLGGGAFAPETRFSAGLAPRDVLVTDVDRDGVPDLVTANSSSEDISFLRGFGDGTFAPDQRFVTDGSSEFLVLLDFDLDGEEDLAVAPFRETGGGSIGIYVHQ